MTRHVPHGFCVAIIALQYFIVGHTGALQKKKEQFLRYFRSYQHLTQKSCNNSVLHTQIYDVNSAKMQLIFQGSKEYC